MSSTDTLNHFRAVFHQILATLCRKQLKLWAWERKIKEGRERGIACVLFTHTIAFLPTHLYPLVSPHNRARATIPNSQNVLCRGSNRCPLAWELEMLPQFVLFHQDQCARLSTPRAGNPGNVLLTSRNPQKYFYQCVKDLPAEFVRRTTFVLRTQSPLNLHLFCFARDSQ